MTKEQEFKVLANQYRHEYQRVNGKPFEGELSYTGRGWVTLGTNKLRWASFMRVIGHLFKRPTFNDKVKVSEEITAIIELSKECVKDLMARLRQPDFIYKGKTDKEKELWSRITALDKLVGPGPVPGRHLRFSVCDGYADYIISEASRDFCCVELIATPDGYTFEGEVDGSMATAVAKRNIDSREQYAAMMANAKPVTSFNH